jgi:hypothetical protein
MTYHFAIRRLLLTFIEISFMKQFILSLLFCGLGTLSASAQIAAKGSSFISVGYGFPSATKLLGSRTPYLPTAQGPQATGDFKFRGFGPLHLRYEYMVGGRVGLGFSMNAEFGHFNLNSTFVDANNALRTSNNKFQFNSFNTLGRFNFHFLKNSKYLDVYWASGIGFGKSKCSWMENPDVNAGDPVEQTGIKEFEDYVSKAFPGFDMEHVVGIRWAMSPNAGIYVEAGKSKSIIQIGIFGKMGKFDSYERNYWRRLN